MLRSCRSVILMMKSIESLNKYEWQGTAAKSIMLQWFFPPPLEMTSPPCPARGSSFGVSHHAYSYDSVVPARWAKPHWSETWGPFLLTWMRLTLGTSWKSFHLCSKFLLRWGIFGLLQAWLACWTRWCCNELFLCLLISLNSDLLKGWGHISTYVLACLAPFMMPGKYYTTNKYLINKWKSLLAKYKIGDIMIFFRKCNHNPRHQS